MSRRSHGLRSKGGGFIPTVRMFARQVETSATGAGKPLPGGPGSNFPLPVCGRRYEGSPPSASAVLELARSYLINARNKIRAQPSCTIAR